MAYDGVTWNEALPDNNTTADTIDDEMRDKMKAVRSRMAHEHVWPASQTGTGEAGWHTFITMSAQPSTPGLVYGTSTQEGAIFLDANKHLTFEDSAGSTYILARSAGGLALAAGTGTQGAIPYITSGGGAALVAAGSTNSVFVAKGSGANPQFVAMSTLVGIAKGRANHGSTIAIPAGFATTNCTIIVGLGDLGTYSGGDGDNLQQIRCSVDTTTRIVTCTGVTRDNSTITGTANYIIIGTASA